MVGSNGMYVWTNGNTYSGINQPKPSPMQSLNAGSFQTRCGRWSTWPTSAQPHWRRPTGQSGSQWWPLVSLTPGSLAQSLVTFCLPNCSRRRAQRCCHRQRHAHDMTAEATATSSLAWALVVGVLAWPMPSRWPWNRYALKQRSSPLTAIEQTMGYERPKKGATKLAITANSPYIHHGGLL